MAASPKYYIVAFSYLLAIIVAEPIKFNHLNNNNNSVTKSFSTNYKQNYVKSVASNEYNKMRTAFMKLERSRSYGALMDLNDRERLANDIIMSYKLQEFNEGFINPYKFNPSQHFFEVLDKIKESKLYQSIQAMPKGGVLHSHDTALVGEKLILQLTYKDNLWLCHKINGNILNPIEFRFSKNEPLRKRNDCQWALLKELRQEYTSEWIDNHIADNLTLFPETDFVDINAVWDRFIDIFILFDGIVLYAPAWRDYYYGALKEFYEDGVQYLEFRSVVPQLYDLDNDELPQMYTVQVYVETLAQFQKEYPQFIGSKMIYSPQRRVNISVVDNYIQNAIAMIAAYPEFVVGFDLVGQEDKGTPLKEFAASLLEMPKNINFYFHAAETNWNGAPTDENLIDAILLGTKRIGHGFGLLKHPAVLDVIKERNIAIEVNPISNQVLRLVDDLRNHPVVYLFANNYPVVISSDDPAFWKASPLSHDFYVAFLSLTSAHSDLRFLKQLAVNSIAYSSMTINEKEIAMIKWRQSWDEYIESVIERKF